MISRYYIQRRTRFKNLFARFDLRRLIVEACDISLIH